MSYCNLSSFYPCENLQGQLTDYFQTCSASELREPTPLFDFLMSPENASGLQQEVVSAEGKVKTINLKYQKRYGEDVVQTNQTNPNCSNSNEPQDCVQSYTIDPTRNWQWGFKWDIKKMADVCQNDQMQFAKEIQRTIDVVMRKMATDITADMVTLIGRWNTNVANVVGGDQLNVATLKSVTSGEINPVLFETIDLAAMQTNYCGQKIIFSGTNLYSYFRASAYAGCCSNEGIGIDNIWQNFGTVVAYDKRVATALGGNAYALMTQPGAVALLHYNRFSSQYVIGGQGTNYDHFVVQDPKTGFPLDVTITDTCGVISVNVTATAKVVGLPQDLYAVGDEQWGVTYVNKLKVVNS